MSSILLSNFLKHILTMGQTAESPRVFVAHSKYFTVPVKSGNKLKHTRGPRATVAIAKVGDCIQWGISMCMQQDNWDPTEGARIATERLFQEYKKICLVTPKPNSLAKVMEQTDEAKFLIRMANDIADSVTGRVDFNLPYRSEEEALEAATKLWKSIRNTQNQIDLHKKSMEKLHTVKQLDAALALQ